MKHFLRVMLIVLFAGLFAMVYANSEINITTTESNNLAITNITSFEKVNTDFGEAYYIPTSSTVKFNIDDSIFYQNANRQNVEIIVDYLDLECNYFYLTYDGIDNFQKLYKDYTELYNTKKVKRSVISLKDAYFGNRLNSSDFTLTVPKSDYGNGIYIYGASVIIKDTFSKIDISAKSDSPGNIFFDGDKKALDIIFTNNFDEDVALNVEYTVKDKDTKDVYYTDTNKITVNKNSVFNDKVSIHSVTKYNTYILEVTCYSFDKNILSSAEFDFSFCKDGSITGGNQKLGIGAHFNWGRESEKGIEIIKNAGITSIREGYSWSEFEKKEKEYIQTSENTAYIENAYKNDVNLLVMAGYGNTLYCGDHYKNMPTDDASRKAYADYIYEMLRINPGKIEIVEIWNEPNLESYNYNGGTPLDYVKMLKAVHDRISSDFPDVKIAGPALASAFLEEGLTYLEEILSADIDGDNEGDAYKYFDIITFHHYTTTYTNIISHIKTFRAVLDKYNCSDKDIYATEFGNSEVGGAYYIDTQEGTKTLRGEDKQADMVSRFLLTLTAATDTQRWYIYDFSNDGFVENYVENTFGLVESVEHNVPYAAKKALLAVSNINNLISDCDKAEYVVSGYSYIMKFTDSIREYDVYALFTNASTNQDYSFTPGGKKVEFYDMYGNKLDFSDTDGMYELKLSNRPIYAKVYNNTDRKFDVKLKDEKVNVSGILKGNKINDLVSVKVYDKSENLVYIDQKKLDENLEFSFEFSHPAYVYEYSVCVGSSDFDELYRFDVDISDLFNATVKIHNNGNLINTVEKFASNSLFDAEVKLIDESIENFNMIIAYYKTGSLCALDSVKSSDMQNDNGTYKIALNNKNAEFDIVKIYLLDSIVTLSPLINNIIIE